MLTLRPRTKNVMTHTHACTHARTLTHAHIHTRTHMPGCPAVHLPAWACSLPPGLPGAPPRQEADPEGVPGGEAARGGPLQAGEREECTAGSIAAML